MDKKSEKLLCRIEKAGIRASRKEGHVVTETELLNLKVQVLPAWVRLLLVFSGVGSAVGSYFCFSADATGYGILLAILGVALLFFGMFGVRRTLSAVLESMDVVISGEIIGLALDGVSSAVGSMFDGV